MNVNFEKKQICNDFKGLRGDRPRAWAKELTQIADISYLLAVTYFVKMCNLFASPLYKTEKCVIVNVETQKHKNTKTEMPLGKVARPIITATG